MAEREQTLADFQACTGLDDVEICITILEQYEWNLMPAVQSQMPDDHEGTSAGVSMAGPDISHFSDLTGASTLPTPGASMAAGASNSLVFPHTSNAGRCTRMLHFSVEYRTKTISVVLPDTETVGKIKEVFSQNMSIPVQEMQLCGFKKKIDDSHVLRDLELPAENKLYILTPNIAVTVSTRSTPANENVENKYTLNITYEDHPENRQFNLSFSGSKTVHDIRLADSGISYPTHNLSFSKALHKNRPPTPKPINIGSDSEEELDVIESFPDEEIFIPDDVADSARSRTLYEEIFIPDDVADSARSRTLLPPDVTNEVEALEHFTQHFYNRYGETHPVFYVGTLDDAVRDSLLVKARDRKPLAIYLHHDGSILSNVFCSQILCSESIVNFLTANFLMWAWDLTHDSNKNRWLSLATQHFGSMPSAHLRSLSTDQLPMLLILMRTRGSNEVFTVIPGSTTLDELMTTLIHAVEVFQRQQAGDITEEDERDKREMIKQEQDEAYQLSLQADRAKDKAVEVQQAQIKKEEEKRQEEEQMKEAIMKSLAMSLPDEPPPQCTQPVSQFRIRTPNGETISRRMLASEPLEVLLKYITSTGYDTDMYKVLTTFPRRDVTELDHSTSLKALSLFPQETLILEER